MSTWYPGVQTWTSWTLVHLNVLQTDSGKSMQIGIEKSNEAWEWFKSNVNTPLRHMWDMYRNILNKHTKKDSNQFIFVLHSNGFETSAWHLTRNLLWLIVRANPLAWGRGRGGTGIHFLVSQELDKLFSSTELHIQSRQRVTQIYIALVWLLQPCSIFW